MRSKLFIALSVLVFFVSCNQTPKYIQNVSPGQFLDLIKQDGKALVIDVRTPSEFKQGYIETAINIPLHKDIHTSFSQADTAKKILLYCRSGNRSVEAAKLLHKQGFSQLYNLTDGIIGWKGVKYGVVQPSE